MIRFEQSVYRDSPVFLNENMIAAVQPKYDGKTKIYMAGDGEPFIVRHEYDEVINMLRKAGVVVYDFREEK